MVIIVALIAVVLLGGVPGMATGTMDAASQSYWRSTTPFKITEWAQVGTTLHLTVSNGANQRLILRNMTVGGHLKDFGTGMAISAGGQKYFNITGFPACDRVTYDSYEYNVSIYYDSTDIGGMLQPGQKLLSGNCVYS